MIICQWCGDDHPIDKLCGRAQRGMTRRAFCFLFGAGAAAALALPKLPAEEFVTGILRRGEIVNPILYDHDVRRFAVSFPNGERWIFNGLIDAISPVAPVDGKTNAQITIRPTSEIEIGHGLKQHATELLFDGKSVGPVQEIGSHHARNEIEYDIRDGQRVALPGLRRTSFSMDVVLDNPDSLDNLFKEMWNRGRTS